MLRKAALALLPIALLAASCGSSASESDTRASMAPPTATVAANTTAQPTTQTGTRGTTTGQDAASALFNTVNPFQLLGNLSGTPSSESVDPALKLVLLKSSNLPGGFTSMGDFTYNVPSQYGTAQLAANMFSKGDFTGGQFSAMVMSAAVALPADTLSKFNELGGWQKLNNLSSADLQQLQSAAQGFGIAFNDLRVLDGSRLGDGGIGMHMVLDLSGLLQAFGAPAGGNPFPSGIAMDIYMFMRGDHMFMTMVVWPADGSSGVDSHVLAEALDANAAGTF